MEQARLPEWEADYLDDVIRQAEERLRSERAAARVRAVQLAREQAYHRLAVEIDRPTRSAGPGQLRLFPEDPTLFDDVC